VTADALHAGLVTVHIGAGAAGLVLAGPVLLAPKRRGWHPRLGRAYVAVLALMCGTALGLASYDPVRLAGLAILAVGTAGAAGTGVWLARTRPRGWYARHVRLMGGSVIAFVTAFVVQLADGHPAAWVLPTAVGVPLIERSLRPRTSRPAPRRGAAPAKSVSPSGGPPC
jgi:hypothetical protein